MALDLQQDHQAIAWEHWLAQFANKPYLESLVNALLQPGASLQAALLQLYQDRWLDTAEGVQLDGIGQIVGQSRVVGESVYIPFFGFVGQPGIDGFGKARIRRNYENPLAASTTLRDPEYRQLLYWKIAINNGHGTAPEIAASMEAIFGAGRVTVADAGNAKIRVWIAKLPGPSDIFLNNPARWVPKAAGVGVIAITGSPDDRPFGFASQGFYGFGVGVMAHSLITG